MPLSRRDALLAGTVGIASATALGAPAGAQVRGPAHSTTVDHSERFEPGQPGRDYRPVTTPDGAAASIALTARLGMRTGV